MNVYRAALVHVRLLLGITFAGIVITILAEQWSGHSTIPFALCALVLLAANRRLGRFTCPSCGSNLFVRKRIALPWPNRRCSQCGIDLDQTRG
jgi:predicted RNA-binding Zn-ribbon protein involved in translation (DUF1610 family)